MNTPETAAALDHAVAGQGADRLPWTAPVLDVYDAVRLTLNGGNNNGDNFGSTQTS